jgi:hypothetical protein
VTYRKQRFITILILFPIVFLLMFSAHFFTYALQDEISDDTAPFAVAEQRSMQDDDNDRFLTSLADHLDGLATLKQLISAHKPDQLKLCVHTQRSGDFPLLQFIFSSDLFPALNRDTLSQLYPMLHKNISGQKLFHLMRVERLKN